MELLLSAISAGGLVGAGNQYLCLVVLSLGARLGLVQLAAPVDFMTAWWFIGLMALFWLLTILPAYGSLLSPGVMNVLNTITNFVSGFMVPISAALLTLASVGVIAEMHPELYHFLQSLQIFDAAGQAVGTTGWLMAGGGAVTASALTGAKFLAKPALSTATGTAGTASAPTYATIENVASVILMGLAYLLTQINPWLLVGLFAIVTLLVLGILAWAVYQLWKLGRGIGRAIRLLETHPKAGLAVIAEFFVWGSGWLLWRHWNRGVVRLLLWCGWVIAAFFALPAIGAMLSIALAPIPFLAFLVSVLTLSTGVATVMGGLYAGAKSAGGLLHTFDDAGQPIPHLAHTAPTPAQ